MNICGSIPEPHRAGVRVLQDPDGDVIDHGLVLGFRGPASFTGEDVVEFQCHGSIAIVHALQNALLNTGMARPAEAGEFTRRALENNRLDLAQVEGLSDLIDAETESQRKQSMRVFSGALGDRVEVWRGDLIRAASLIEATIDFADEEVPVDVTPEVLSLLAGVQQSLGSEIAGVKIAERVRTGFEVAIVGPPNAGKSTLLNALAGREAAITSEIAGTTRDVIEVRMDLAGLPVTILDTAGIRESADIVEKIGIDRARDRASQADLRVFIDRDFVSDLIDDQDGDIFLRGKVDTDDGLPSGISGKTGLGLDVLVDQITRCLQDRVQDIGVATHDRHRVAMQGAQEYLSAAVGLLALGPDHYDIASEELRAATRTLETLVGRIDVENLLDEIFSRFCIGK
jgi:tRNA modification GTPase